MNSPISQDGSLTLMLTGEQASYMHDNSQFSSPLPPCSLQLFAPGAQTCSCIHRSDQRLYDTYIHKVH